MSVSCTGTASRVTQLFDVPSAGGKADCRASGNHGGGSDRADEPECERTVGILIENDSSVDLVINIENRESVSSGDICCLRLFCFTGKTLLC